MHLSHGPSLPPPSHGLGWRTVWLVQPRLTLANARIGTSSDLQAIVIEGADIVAVLASDESGGPNTVDLQGRTVIPGIDDSHLHAYAFGRTLTAIDLRDAQGLREVQQVLAAARPERTGWYRGHGWESTVVHGSGPAASLCAADIDACTSDAPALLADSTGHAALCNTLALRIAGLDSDTSDPSGGVIVRDDHGQPTGLLLEAAVGLVAGVIPDISRAERRSAIAAAQAHLLAQGIVAMTDPGLGPGATTLLDGTGTLDAVEAYREMQAAGELAIRTHLMLLFGGLGGTRAAQVAAGLDAWGPPMRADRSQRLSIDQVKVFADGIPRSRTAWVSEPYDDCTHGHLTVAGSTDAERVRELHAIIGAAAERGWQVGAHCTGDATIGAVIDGVLRTGTGPSLRHYVIHGDLIQHADLDRLRAAHMTLNANPSIRWTVGRRVSAILGQERNLRKQPLRTAMDTGVNLACSSDAPVVPPSWQAIWAAAVTRALRDDPAYRDAQCITANEAIASMSTNAAWQSREESWRGRIAPGMAADLVVLDDVMDWEDPWSWIKRRPQAVLIDGRLAHGSLA